MQPSRNQKLGDSSRLRAFVVKAALIHHEGTKTRCSRNCAASLTC